jgi:uncharacterized protein
MKKSKYVTVVEQNNGDLLVHSGLSGAVLNVTKENVPEHRLLMEGQIPGTSDPLLRMAYETILNAFRKAMFLVDDNINELGFLKSRYSTAKFDSTFTQVTVAPTMKCNLACRYCYNPKETQTTMSKETIDRTALFIGDHLKMSRDTVTPLGVTWIGGEPLMEFATMTELAERIVGVASEYDREVTGTLVTNGTLLTEDIAACLGGHPYFINNIQITLDGPQHKHDTSRCFADGRPSYDKICKNIKIAKKHRLRMVVRINADASFAINDFELLMGEMLQRGIAKKGENNPSFYVARIHSHAHDTCVRLHAGDRVLSVKAYANLLLETAKLASKQSFPYIFRTFQDPRGIGCGVVKENGFTIDPDGHLGKCWHAVGSNKHCVGRVHETLDCMDNKYRRWYDYDPFKNERCRECHVLPLCMGGCAEAHMRVGGMQDEPCIPEKYTLKKTLLFYHMTDDDKINLENYDGERI